MTDAKMVVVKTASNFQFFSRWRNGLIRVDSPGDDANPDLTAFALAASAAADISARPADGVARLTARHDENAKMRMGWRFSRLAGGAATN